MSIEVISLLYLGVLLILAKLMEEGFRRIGLVPFVGSIMVGIVVGDGGFGIIHINEIISFITSLGIIFLLFLAGAEEFDIRGEIRIQFFISSIVQLTIPFLTLVLTLYYMGRPENFLLLSVPLAMSSAGPLTRLLIDVGYGKKQQGNFLFYQVIINEIIAVILFAILENTKEFLISLVEVITIMAGIVLTGRYISLALERLELIFKVREIEFAGIISTILVIGFIAESYKFNSAIAALFLGFLLKDYLRDRPELREKLHAFTYGFFEPLFFVSIGLYFVRVTALIFEIGIILSVVTILSKILVGAATSKIIRLPLFFNAMGTSVKGGVDTSLLITALSLSYINGIEYSESVLAITVSTLIIPVVFKRIYGVKSEASFGDRKIKLSQQISSLNRELVYVACEDRLSDAIKVLMDRKVRGVAVVDGDMRPIGYVSMNTALAIDPSLYDKLRVCDVELDEIETVDEKSKVIDVIKVFRETEKPIISVIDDKGKLVNVLYEREIMRLLIGE